MAENKTPLDDAARDNRSRQLNPEDETYSSSRGTQSEASSLDDAARENRARQLNPNNDAYWRARGQTKLKNG